MNELKFMPGNWFVSHERGTLVTANNGETYQWQMSNVCMPYGHNDEQRIATAKLIAAAPDMIAALLLIYRDYIQGKKWDGRKGDERKITVTQSSLDAIRLAIEKATI